MLALATDISNRVNDVIQRKGYLKQHADLRRLADTEINILFLAFYVGNRAAVFS
jgi:hypothetical protein